MGLIGHYYLGEITEWVEYISETILRAINAFNKETGEEIRQVVSVDNVVNAAAAAGGEGDQNSRLEDELRGGTDDLENAVQKNAKHVESNYHDYVTPTSNFLFSGTLYDHRAVGGGGAGDDDAASCNSEEQDQPPPSQPSSSSSSSSRGASAGSKK